MRKYLLIIIILFLAACVRTVPTFTPDPNVRTRTTTLLLRVSKEIKITVPTYLRNTQVINAWTDGETMNITLGAMRYDDDTITFIMAHELSHVKLSHVRNRNILSGGITAAMIAVGFIIPGAGVLNHLVNPVATNAFSRDKELDADKLASETCLKLGIPISRQIEIMNNLRKLSEDGGGFWSQHPSWDDRIQNISR